MMNEGEDKNQRVKTYGVRNVIGSVMLFYVIIVMFSTQGIYNWSTKLGVSPFTQDLQEWSEFIWATASEYGLEEPRHSLDSWFLSLQDAHVLLYPKTYAKTKDLIQKRQLRRMEKDRLEKSSPKLAARLQKQRQVMDPDADISKGKRPRVLIVGDSIMMTVGPVIKDTVANKMSGSAVVKAKLATGLARPDVFDWNNEIKGVVSKSKFDLIVMMLGTNDSQDFAENGKIFNYGSTEWVEIYNKRLLNVMQTACVGAKKVIWLGLPPMKSVNFDRKAHRINSWTKKQALSSGCVDFVSTNHMLGDDEGKFASYLKVGDHLEKIRTTDGIHVTKKGGQVVSDFLVDYVKSNQNSKAKTLAH
jgi:hypothetical protein